MKCRKNSVDLKHVRNLKYILKKREKTKKEEESLKNE